uniref:DUF538 domain-containing protein n=1 Tax=Salix viminalis TaxID=40686 RepID=A0A6N2LWK4_SALVM
MENSHLGITLLSLFLFFSLSKSTLSQDPPPKVFEILQKFGLPSGLLPNTVKSYSLSDDGSFTVYLEKECHVEFDCLVNYEKKITGKLGYGSITNLKGIQVQKFFLWLDVDEIKTVHSCRAGVSYGSLGGLWKQFLEEFEVGLPRVQTMFTLPSSDGSFEVKLKTTCYVHFDDVVYYDKVIKGKMSYGSVHDVSGIQAKKLFVWLPVTGIEVSKVDDGMVSFFVGPISEELPAKQFEDVPVCKRKFQPPVDAIAFKQTKSSHDCRLTLNIEALQLNRILRNGSNLCTN